MAIFCFFGRTRKFVRKGDPKRYLYFWGKGINKHKTIIFAFCVK